MDATDSVDFRLLGPVEVDVGGERIALNGKQRSLLAVLMLQVNRVVSVERLSAALWYPPLPASPATRVRILVSELRKACAAAGDDLIVTQPPGYLLRIPPGRLDLDRFTTALEQAHEALAAEQPEQAVLDYERALGQWRGAALGGVGGPFTRMEAPRLAELRLRAQEDRVEQLAALGRHAELIADLVGLVAAHPLRERPHGQLMRALYRSGRRSEALDLYRQLRDRLADELGLEPGPQIQQLHQQLLTADPALDHVTRPAAPQPPSPAQSAIVPTRQLPADIGRFVGREEELRHLDALAGGSDRLVLIVGVAGTGKTALAVRWAHSAAARFPDGQIFLDMRGFDRGSRMHPAEALPQVLQALGVPAEKVPISPDAQIPLYRSTIAGRRVLLVLDNVAEPDQVRPLLPGDPGSLVLVTSRDRLGGLVAMNDARRLTLDVLTPTEAVDVLVHTAGPEVVRGDPEALAELARLCGYLPLALRIAGGRIADQPHRGIRRHVAELGSRGRMAQLRVDGDDRATVRATFDLSYQALAPTARRMFRLVSLVPAPAGLATHGAAALAATPVAEAEQLLDMLARVHLVKVNAAGRYTCHDLLLDYAAELADVEDEEAEKAAAIRRLLDFYLVTTDRCGALTVSPTPLLTRDPPAAGMSPLSLDGVAKARGWLASEWDNLVAAINHAADRGPHPLAWHLADALRGAMYLQATPPQWHAVIETGLAVASGHGDRLAEAALRYSLGMLHWRMADFAASIAEGERCLELFRSVGSKVGESTALRGIAVSHAQLGKLDLAISRLAQALEIDREVGDIELEAADLTNLAAAHEELGQLAKAADLHALALPLLRATSQRLGEAITLHDLGMIRRGQGRLDEALDALKQSLTICREIGSRHEEASTLINVGAVYRDSGHYEQAKSVLTEALRIVRQVDDARLEVLANSELASVDIRVGRLTAAVTRLAGALDTAERTGHQRGRVEALLALAEAHGQRQEHQIEYDHAARALALARESGNMLATGLAHHALAAACFGLGDIRGCLDNSRRALLIQFSVGQRLAMARTLCTLGEAYAVAGSVRVAQSCGRRAYRIFTEIGAPEAAQAARLMA